MPTSINGLPLTGMSLNGKSFDPIYMNNQKVFPNKKEVYYYTGHSNVYCGAGVTKTVCNISAPYNNNLVRWYGSQYFYQTGDTWMLNQQSEKYPIYYSNDDLTLNAYYNASWNPQCVVSSKNYAPAVTYNSAPSGSGSGVAGTFDNYYEFISYKDLAALGKKYSLSVYNVPVTYSGATTQLATITVSEDSLIIFPDGITIGTMVASYGYSARFNIYNPSRSSVTEGGNMISDYSGRPYNGNMRFYRATAGTNIFLFYGSLYSSASVTYTVSITGNYYILPLSEINIVSKDFS